MFQHFGHKIAGDDRDCNEMQRVAKISLDLSILLLSFHFLCCLILFPNVFHFCFAFFK